MLYGAAGAGVRAMTSSSSPGISLKAEGISYIAAADLPCVIVNVMRGGPGLGGIQPAQSDYFQATKGGGHGDYHLYVMAPNSVQEIVDFTARAFNIAEKYRIPVMILSDGTLGQMMEPVDFEEIEKPGSFDKSWATTGTKKQRKHNIINTLYLSPEELEQTVIERQKKYDYLKEHEQSWEEKYTRDADIIVSSYGITSRVVESAVTLLRNEGLNIGIIRPKTLWPFPEKPFIQTSAKAYLSVEMSMGQMIEDIERVIAGKAKTYFFGRTGGVIPSPEEIKNKIKEIAKEINV